MLTIWGWWHIKSLRKIQEFNQTDTRGRWVMFLVAASSKGISTPFICSKSRKINSEVYKECMKKKPPAAFHWCPLQVLWPAFPLDGCNNSTFWEDWWSFSKMKEQTSRKRNIMPSSLSKFKSEHLWGWLKMSLREELVHQLQGAVNQGDQKVHPEIWWYSFKRSVRKVQGASITSVTEKIQKVTVWLLRLQAFQQGH